MAFKMKGFPQLGDLQNDQLKSQVGNGTNRQPMLSEYKEDSIFTKLKTIISNPFDAIKVAYQGGRSDQGDYTHSSLTNLRRAKDAADAGNPDAQQSFNRTSAFNTAASLTPYAMAASTIADLASGDPTGAILKKVNKIPGFKNVIKDPKKAAKVAKGIYKTYKTDKQL